MAGLSEEDRELVRSRGLRPILDADRAQAVFQHVAGEAAAASTPPGDIGDIDHHGTWESAGGTTWTRMNGVDGLGVEYRSWTVYDSDGQMVFGVTTDGLPMLLLDQPPGARDADAPPLTARDLALIGARGLRPIVDEKRAQAIFDHVAGEAVEASTPNGDLDAIVHIGTWESESGTTWTRMNGVDGLGIEYHAWAVYDSAGTMVLAVSIEGAQMLVPELEELP